MNKLHTSLLSSVLFLSASFSANVFADEVIKTFPAGGAKEMLANPHKGSSPNKDVVKDAGGAIKIKKECTGSDGKVTFQGDAAYEACLKEKLNQPKK